MRLPAVAAVSMLCACSGLSEGQSSPAPVEVAPSKVSALVEKKIEKFEAAPQTGSMSKSMTTVHAPVVMGGLGTRGAGVGGGGIGGLGVAGSGGAQGMGMGTGAMRGNAKALASRQIVSGLLGSGAAASYFGNTESYGNGAINPWTETEKDRLSTFAADVDTASYAVARRKIFEGELPPREAVRVEEYLNYFRYSYPAPTDGALAVTMDAAPSPFTPGKHLVRVGVQGRRLSVSERKPAHLTFLVDVSGSMQSPDKLPLAKRALRLLVDNLRDGDTVSLVTYAGAVRLVLAPTGMERKADIHQAIEDLQAGGSTAMASGIELAYQQAHKTLDDKSISRVVILSDGDANIGPATPAELLAQIQGYVKEGITVTTVGFGMGNYKDDLMEQFANKGNGNHAYVDTLFEAKRLFQTQLGGTLEVIAQDVKLQVDFDPAQVKRYRLVGYENRDIADADFRNDRVDAGEIGSGHTVTALYEVELLPGAGEQLCTVRVRAKKPRGVQAVEAAFPFRAEALAQTFDAASRDFRFAVSVMGAAEVLRRSPSAKTWRLEAVTQIARQAAGDDVERQEFVALLTRAAPLVADRTTTSSH